MSQLIHNLKNRIQAVKASTGYHSQLFVDVPVQDLETLIRLANTRAPRQVTQEDVERARALVGFDISEKGARLILESYEANRGG